MIKTCKRCGTPKTLAEFYKDKALSDGYSSICKTCRNVSMNKWREANRAKYNSSMRDFRSKNKEWAKNNDLMRSYGITLEDYNRMLEEQGHVCKICKQAQKGKRPLLVDHCHSTGKVRGILCYGCNRLIVGLDNHPLYDKILEYLKTYK